MSINYLFSEKQFKATNSLSRLDVESVVII